MEYLDKLRQFVQGRGNGPVPQVNQSAANFGNTLKAALTNVNPFGDTDPNQAGRQNLWTNTANQANYGFWHSPVGQGLVGAQRFVESPQATRIVPQIHPFDNRNLVGQVGNVAANLPGDIVNTVVGGGVIDPALDMGRMIGKTITGQPLPQYNTLKSGATKIGYQAGGLINPSQQRDLGIDLKPQEFLANAGQAGAPIATAYGGGTLQRVGKDGLSLAGRQTLGTVLKQGSLAGGKQGAVIGLLQGLADGRDSSLPEQLGSAGLDAAAGFGGGALLGGAVAGVGHGFGVVSQGLHDVLTSKHGFTDLQADQAIRQFARDELGKFSTALRPLKAAAGRRQVEGFVRSQRGMRPDEPVYYGDLREALGLPRHGNYQEGKIDFSVKVGDQDKTIGQLQQAHQDPSLTKYEQAFNAGDTRTLDELAAQHPGDARFQVHIQPAQGPEAPQGAVPAVASRQPGKTAPTTAGYIDDLIGAQQTARGGGPTGLREKAQTFLDEVKRKLVDSTAPIEDVLSEAQKRGKYRVLPGADISPQIDRAIRSHELAGQFLKDNGMVDVIRRVPNINALNQYLIAKHAPDVEAAGFKTGRDAVRDAQLVKDLAPTYETYAQQVTQYGQKLLDYAIQTGLVSKETAALLKQKYPNYVPLNRIFDELEKASVPEGAGVRGVASLSRQSVVQRLKGSDRAIENPIESLLVKTTDAFAQGERNQAGKLLAGYRNLPGFQGLIREVKPGESATHTFSYLEGGVKHTYETTPEIAAAAKFLDKRQLGFVGNLFALPVRFAKLGITGINIPFIASNVVKDQVSAAINSNKALQTSIANPSVFLRSLWTAVGHGDKYDQWVRSGSGGTSFDIARSEPGVSVGQIRSGRNIPSRIAYTATHPGELLRAVENVVGRSEEMTRLQQYIGTKEALLKEGRTPQDAEILAAQASRNNTVNFGRSGDWGKALNSVFLYMNAGIQGSRTLIRSLQTRPVETAAKLGLTVLMPVSTVTAWNLSDPKRAAAYNDIKDFEKDNNLIIIPPNPVKDPKTGKWQVIKVPFSQEIANLTVPVRKGIEGMYGYDKPGFGDVAKALIGTGTSLNVQNPQQLAGQFIPQAVKPWLEAELNKNTFTNTDVVPQYINGQPSKDLPPEMQVRPDTSGTARVVGKVLDTSPLKVEQFVKSSFGGVGSQLLNASDHALAAAGAIPEDQIGGQSILAGLKQRFSQAAGDQQLTNLYDKGQTVGPADTSLPAPKYEPSSAAPKNIFETLGLYGRALFTDPGNTVNGVLTGQPLDRISGNAAIYQRNVALSALDKGDGIVDHIIPLSLGGSNTVDNLQVQNPAESEAKDQIELTLARKLKAGQITKQEAQKQMKEWMAQNNIGTPVTDAAQQLGVTTDTLLSHAQSPSDSAGQGSTSPYDSRIVEKNGKFYASLKKGNIKTYDTKEEAQVSVAEQALKDSDQNYLDVGNVTLVKQDNGKIKQVDISKPIAEPQLSGDDLLDKKLVSEYKGKLTSRATDIVDLYQAGKLSQDDAEKALQDLQDKTPTTPKKPRKAAFPKISGTIKPITVKPVASRSTSPSSRRRSPARRPAKPAAFRVISKNNKPLTFKA
jgi:hypothetical protein